MASDITDLESQLLTLTKRRVEIDSQWIEIQEKLLAARGSVLDEENQEVPPISESLEAGPNMSPTQTTSTQVQIPPTVVETNSNAGNVQEVAESSRPVRSEVLAKETASVNTDEVDVLPQSSNPEETVQVTRAHTTPNISELPQSSIPREIQVTVPHTGFSMPDPLISFNSEETARVTMPRNEPIPPTSFSESTSVLPLSQPTNSKETTEAMMPYPGSNMPPPPTSLPETSSVLPQTSQSVVYPPNTGSRPSDQIVSSQGQGVNLGNRRLLRPHTSSGYPQTQSDVHNMFQNASVPQNAQSAQALFSMIPSRHERDLMRMDPRNTAAWQPLQSNMQPQRIKTEDTPYSPYFQGPPQAQMPHSHAGYPQPQQPHFHSSTEPLRAPPQSRNTQAVQNLHEINAHTGPRPQDTNPRRRQRSPSIQIMDARPRQRPRLAEDVDRLPTPPLNQRIKVEEGNHDTIRFARAQAPPPIKRDNVVSRRSDGHANASVNTNQESYHRQLLAPGSHRNVPVRPTAEKQPRNNTRGNRNVRNREEDEDEDYNDDDEESGVDDEVPVPNIRYQRPQMSNPRLENLVEYSHETSSPLTERLATRRAFNAYRVNVPKPLSYAERQELELRYCARVAMVIGSKRCVMAPCVQVSKTKNIFTIMRQKFGHVEEDKSVEPVNPNTLYRSASDFVADARGMLKCYVKLGHCEPCPFKVTGNERVMCWRMRLESVLDEKMRGLKKCLKECEDIYEADDMDGRAKHVDAWFSEEELRDEAPIV